MSGGSSTFISLSTATLKFSFQNVTKDRPQKSFLMFIRFLLLISDREILLIVAFLTRNDLSALSPKCTVPKLLRSNIINRPVDFVSVFILKWHGSACSFPSALLLRPFQKNFVHLLNRFSSLFSYSALKLIAWPYSSLLLSRRSRPWLFICSFDF